VCECLLAILQSNYAETQKHMLDVHSILYTQLTKIANKHHQTLSRSDKTFSLSLPAIFTRARWAVLAVVRLYLCGNVDVATMVLNDKENTSKLLDIAYSTTSAIAAKNILGVFRNMYGQVLSGGDHRVPETYIDLFRYILNKLLVMEWTDSHNYDIGMTTIDMIIDLLRACTKSMQTVRPLFPYFSVQRSLKQCIRFSMAPEYPAQFGYCFSSGLFLPTLARHSILLFFYFVLFKTISPFQIFAVQLVRVWTLFLYNNAANMEQFSKDIKGRLAFYEFMMILLPSSRTYSFFFFFFSAIS